MADGGKSDGRLVFDCLSAVLLLLVAVLGEDGLCCFGVAGVHANSNSQAVETPLCEHPIT